VRPAHCASHSARRGQDRPGDAQEGRAAHRTAPHPSGSCWVHGPPSSSRGPGRIALSACRRPDDSEGRRQRGFPDRGRVSACCRMAGARRAPKGAPCQGPGRGHRDGLPVVGADVTGPGRSQVQCRSAHPSDHRLVVPALVQSPCMPHPVNTWDGAGYPVSSAVSGDGRRTVRRLARFDSIRAVIDLWAQRQDGFSLHSEWLRSSRRDSPTRAGAVQDLASPQPAPTAQAVPGGGRAWPELRRQPTAHGCPAVNDVIGCPGPHADPTDPSRPPPEACQCSIRLKLHPGR
jgi:hypothetical protein